MIRRILLTAIVSLSATAARSGIPETEYRDRRARLLAVADSDAVLVFRAAEPCTRSGDVTYPFRQESNLLYLSGITEPGVTLLLVPRGITVDGKQSFTLIFHPPGSSADFAGYGAHDSDVTLDAGRFPGIFSSVIGSARTLLVSAPNYRFLNDWMNNRAVFQEQEARKQLQSGHPGLKIKNAGPLVARLRECKSAAELDLIRAAIRLTGDGLRGAMRVCKPGAIEYELQASLEFEMMRQGAGGTSFPSIVGSGPNSLILHYETNRREMHDSEVVVVDVGAEFGGYAADVTRTLPVSGAFTDEQRQVYAVVLKVQEEVIGMIRSGVRWSALEAKAQEAIAAAGFGHHMPHGVSHHLGLDTHDAGLMDTLRAGMVITVEPGIYIPATDTTVAPRYRGFGVRIEDDVLVSEHGAVVLSSGIPKEIDQVEALIQDSR